MTAYIRENAPAYSSVLPDLSSLHRLSVERYHAFINAGVFDEDDAIELLQGFLVNKMPINPVHSFVTDEVRDQLTACVPKGYFVKSQAPITLDDSEPEPDVFVVCGKKRDFLTRHPSAEEIALLIEVSNATLARDQNQKKTIYAAAGIQVYWIVNLIDEQVEVYSLPSGMNYLAKQTYQRGDQLPVTIDGNQIASFDVDSLLP